MAVLTQFQQRPVPRRLSSDKKSPTARRALITPLKAYTATVTVTDVSQSSNASKKLLLDKPLPATPKFEMGSVDSTSNPTPDAATAEFEGDLDVTDALPAKSVLQKVANLPVLDANGKELPFRTLYEGVGGEKKLQRVMVIFIRHFFCGNCQEYLRTLSTALPSPSELLSLSTPTSIVVVGCGSPTLIPMYTEVTSCPFPIYADPSKRLYQLLGMSRTLSLGRTDPDYIHHTLVTGMVKSIVQGLGRMGKGDALKAGDMRQVGGEFLFEFGRLRWCHRMRNTRDHAEVPILSKMLGVEDDRKPQPKRRWTTNLTRITSTRRPSWADRKTSFSAVRRRTSRSPSKERSSDSPTVSALKGESETNNRKALSNSLEKIVSKELVEEPPES